MTIEERANKYVKDNFHRIAEEMQICDGMKSIYCESAAAQQAIDIENCVKWCERYNKDAVENIGMQIDVDSFRQWITNMIIGS